MKRIALASLVLVALAGDHAHGREISLAQCKAIHALLEGLLKSNLASAQSEIKIRERLLYTFVELNEMNKESEMYKSIESLRDEIQMYLDERQDVDKSVQEAGVRAFNEVCS